MASTTIAAFGALLLACARLLPAAEQVPDPQAVRGHIDRLISLSGALHRPATLGLLHDAVLLAIGVGAPAYNNGDLKACSEFYAGTAKQLLAAYPAGVAMSMPAGQGLSDLRDGLRRGGAGDDAQRRAWALRLAFDQISLSWSLAIQHGEQLGRLGGEYFHRGDYEDAEVAYQDVVRDYDEVRGEALPAAAAALRLSPLLHAQALIELGRFAPAAAAVAAHGEEIAEFRVVDIDLRALYGNAIDLERSLLDLERAADEHARDADLRFLYGYQLWFTGSRDQAQQQFDRTLALDPRHAAAALFKPKHEAPAAPLIP
jgi:tetratricopeptide (TPR) repeat protein